MSNYFRLVKKSQEKNLNKLYMRSDVYSYEISG